MIHTPVLLEEVIEYIQPEKRRNIVDATLDGGGHSRELLNRFPESRIVGIEYDPEEFRLLDKDLSARITAVNDSYVNIRSIVKEKNFVPEAVLFDFGVSSWHYEAGKRGFSFQKDEVLDMRFNPVVQTRTAADLVNTESQEQLERILAEYGEEQFSKQIARAIVYSRQDKPVLMTGDLVGIINMSVPSWYRHKKIHPATKTFQALRIAVNDEIGNIRAGLEEAISILPVGGRVLAISFHGLEDKTVREVFNREAKNGKIRWVTKKTIRPKWSEVQRNHRARSAKMKIAEKIN